MAKTIANFLVGVGLDTKDFDKGSKNVDASLSGFRSKAQLAGGAIAAAFGAVSVAAINAGNKTDEFMRKVEKFDTAPKFIYNLGNAFRMMGGDAEDAISTIAKAEGVLDALRKGDASALESAGLAQVNVAQLQKSRDGEDLLKNLSDIMSAPETQDWQRRSLAETFGLSDEGIKLLSQGRGHIESIIDSVDQYAGNMEEAATAGREYAESLSKIGIQFDNIAQSLATKILPNFTSFMDGVSDFVDKNMSRIGAATDYVADNIGAIATIGGGLAVSGAATTGAAVASKLGMRGLAALGRGAAMGGVAGAVAGGTSMLWDLRSSDIEAMTGLEGVGQYYRSPSETWEDIQNWWRGGVSSPADAAQISPSAQANRKPSASEVARSDASVPPPIVLENKLYLNEREIARTVRKVNAEDNYNAYTEVTTTESR